MTTVSEPGAWDWSGIIGTGQSLSVGAPPVLTTTQPYGNLKLCLGPAGNAAVPPWNPDLETLTLVPLVEPIRPLATDYPGPYPGNIYGETPHTAMANQLSALVQGGPPRAHYVSVHSVVGESGQGISELKKRDDTAGITGRAYAATLFEVAAIARLARAQGKTYGVSAIVLTHGETDAVNPSYAAELVQLLADYNADLKAITGQVEDIPLYASQQHAFPSGPGSAGARPVATQVPWRLGVEHPGRFVCTGPKFQYPVEAGNDGVHLAPLGYQLLGEKLGQIHYQRAVLGNDWRPLHPVSVQRAGRRTVCVRFHVPVPPLTWDDTFDEPSLAEWAAGKGFELREGDVRLPIGSVELHGDSVRVTAVNELPKAGLWVGYALTSQGVQLSCASMATRWGKLRDSDPFIGLTSKLPNPNFAVSFELPVP